MPPTAETDANRPVATPHVLTSRAKLARFAAIGAMMLGAAVLFAYTGGWYSPHRLSPNRLMAAFDAADGKFPGFRKNHAKGVCASGRFDSNGQAVRFSRAAVFKPGSTPVIGRFSLAGGMPFQTDAPDKVRAMALRFLPPGAEEWRTGMVSIPVFPFNSVQGFYDQLVASAPDPATGKPDPAKMKAFIEIHPEAARAFALIKSGWASNGFGDSTYNGLNAFRFTNAAGDTIAVRWSAVPVQAAAGETAAPASTTNKDYLFDDLIAAVAAHPRQWHLVITLAQPGDPTNDATVPWPPGRTQVDAGIITIDRISSEALGSCTNVNFDPLVLPAGIEASDDPVLSARSAAYARSFTLRAGQAHEKRPSAITPLDVQSGGKS
jgi:catalase